MVPVRVQTLIISHAPSPSVLVLQPCDENTPLKNGRIIPIWIGAHEATQVGLAIEQARLPRPMTHDLFIDTITNLDAYIDHVLISDVKETTFFARLTLRQHSRLIEIDARPSDAITLALKQEAPLFILEEVLEKASYPYIFKKDHPLNDSDLEEFHSFVKTLIPDDFGR